MNNSVQTSALRTLTDLQHDFQQQSKATFQDISASPEFLLKKFQGYQRNLFQPTSDISPSSSFTESVYLKQRQKKEKKNPSQLQEMCDRNKLELDNKQTCGKIKYYLETKQKTSNNTWAKEKL